MWLEVKGVNYPAIVSLSSLLSRGSAAPVGIGYISDFGFQIGDVRCRGSPITTNDSAVY
jgi:hypothetical protein